MVGTPDPARAALVREIQELLYSNAERFVEADHASGAVLVRFSPLAGLIADLVCQQVAGVRAERAALWALLKDRVRAVIQLNHQNSDLYLEWFDLTTDVAQLRKGVCAVLGYDPDPAAYRGDGRVLADLRDLAGEARVRENEVISLGCELEKLERVLDEAARESATAARFVTTMLA